MLGGFGLCGIPENSIAELVKKDDLTVYQIMLVLTISVLAYYCTKRQIKMISSYVGENAEFERQMLSGELDVELIPRNFGRTLSCCSSNSCFFTPAGYGTEVAEGKEVREFNGKMHVMELAFKADFAIVKLGKEIRQEI
jgi:3-oxoacid CoA-transferase subunit A